MGPTVWTKLAHAQLATGAIKEAVDSYVKASYTDSFTDVIAKATEQGAFKDLVRYLKMARKSMRDQRIDTELVYAYAKEDMLAELEEFIAGDNLAQPSDLGDRLFD